MVYEFNWRVIYCRIYSNVHMMKKKFVFWILFYFIFSLYDIWFIDYEKERNGDLCLGEKCTYKSWFACIYIVINKVYMVTTWSNSSELTFFFFFALCFIFFRALHGPATSSYNEWNSNASSLLTYKHL